MPWNKRITLAFVAYFAYVQAVTGQEPPDRPKVKVEFRWVSMKHIPGVTDEKGNLGEGDGVYYLHKKAILTNTDIIRTRVSTTKLGSLGDKFTIDFEITDEAKRRLAADRGEHGKGSLAAVVDGKILGASYFRTPDMAKFEPFAGYFDTRAEVDRVVEAFKK